MKDDEYTPVTVPRRTGAGGRDLPDPGGPAAASRTDRSGILRGVVSSALPAGLYRPLAISASMGSASSPATR